MFKTVSGKTCLIDRLKTICDKKLFKKKPAALVMEVQRSPLEVSQRFSDWRQTSLFSCLWGIRLPVWR